MFKKVFEFLLKVVVGIALLATALYGMPATDQLMELIPLGWLFLIILALAAWMIGNAVLPLFRNKKDGGKETVSYDFIVRFGLRRNLRGDTLAELLESGGFSVNSYPKLSVRKWCKTKQDGFEIHVSHEKNDLAILGNNLQSHIYLVVRSQLNEEGRSKALTAMEKVAHRIDRILLEQENQQTKVAQPV